MQAQIIGQLNGASEKTVLNDSSKQKTCAFFKSADLLLKEAIDNSEGSLREKMDDKGQIKNSFISDAYVEETYNNEIHRRPVIDLVQQGGGMYGIALIGYTYILEKVGIRFYSHGGTSAGAINAMFLAAISNEVYKADSAFHDGEQPHQAIKSEILTHIIAHTDFSSFMEKEGIVGWLQKRLFKNYKSIGLKLLLVTFVLLFLIVVYGLFGYVYNVNNGISGGELRIYDFIIGTFNVGALLLFVYILLIKVLNVKFGINTGNVFYKWTDDLLASLNIRDTDDLKKQMREITLIPAKDGDAPRLVLITSNLTHNRIVKFPERAVDYWNNSDNIKPAAYLRASMSLPFIYKTFIPDISHFYDQTQLENEVKLKARFVDGGMLSNFPIREFHRNDIAAPRFPTFGILLTEREVAKSAGKITDEQEKNKEMKEAKELKNITLMSYILSFISTFRNFYDNDFLLSNEEINLRVETVNTKGYNWLDFWMKESTKQSLFNEGAKAAIRQLEKFNWEEYKTLRRNQA